MVGGGDTRAVLPAEIDQKDGDVGGGDAGDTGGLTDGARNVTLEFLAAFDGKAGDFVEIETFRYAQILETTHLLHELLFPLNVSFVLKIDFN